MVGTIRKRIRSEPASMQETNDVKKSKKQSTQDYLKSKGYSNLNDLLRNNSQKYPYALDENRLKLKEKYKNDKGIDDYLYKRDIL